MKSWPTGCENTTPPPARPKTNEKRVTKNTLILKPTKVLKNVIQEGKKTRKASRRTTLDDRAQEEQITVARTKEDEEDEEDAGTRPAGWEKYGKKEENKAKRKENTIKQEDHK